MIDPFGLILKDLNRLANKKTGGNFFVLLVLFYVLTLILLFYYVMNVFSKCKLDI